jgi:hypothetical protein
VRASSFPPPGPIAFEHPSLRVTSTGLVIVAHWLAAPDAEAIRAMRIALRPYVSRHESFCSLNVIDIAHASPMTETARTEVARTQKEFEGRQRGLANVIEGHGFWAATIRSVASGVAFVSRVKFEQRIFDEVEPAASWLASLFVPGIIDVPDVVRVAARMRLGTG